MRVSNLVVYVSVLFLIACGEDEPWSKSVPAPPANNPSTQITVSQTGGRVAVTHDIGGFSSLTVPPRTKKLFLRWTELGAFTPIMRTHEGDKKGQNWQWDSDAKTIAHLRHFALIHEALGPEFKALARMAAQTSAPILRHLMLVFRWIVLINGVIVTRSTIERFQPLGRIPRNFGRTVYTAF